MKVGRIEFGPMVQSAQHSAGSMLIRKFGIGRAGWNPCAADDATATVARAAQIEALSELRRWVNARMQTAAVNRDMAHTAGRESVASHRQSDVETLEKVIAEIDDRLGSLQRAHPLQDVPVSDGDEGKRRP